MSPEIILGALCFRSLNNQSLFEVIKPDRQIVSEQIGIRESVTLFNTPTMIGLPVESGMFQSISMIGKMLGAFMAALRAYGLEEKFIFDRLNSDYRTVNDEVYILDKLSRVAKISY